MVLERRLYYGFTSYQVPVVPRASRSARGRRPIRREREASQIRAFEILASVAGNILEDDESSAPSNSVSRDAQFNISSNTSRWDVEDGGKSLKVDASEEGGIRENNLACIPNLQGRRSSCPLDKGLHDQGNFNFKGSLTSEHFDPSGKLNVADNLSTGNSRNFYSSPSCTVYKGSQCEQRVLQDGVECLIKGKPQDGLLSIGSTESRTLPSDDSLLDAVEIDINKSPSISSQSNMEASLLTLTPFSAHSAHTKTERRENDKNTVGYSEEGSMVKTYRPLPHTRDRRIRKFSTSKYCKPAQNLKVGSYFRTDGKAKPVYYNGKSCYSHQRSQKIFPFKKRKFFDENPLTTSDGTFPCEDAFKFLDRRRCGDNYGLATEASSSVAGQHASPISTDCNVKLSIKSFKVPELFVEIPATATIGSLKRTVLEAVTAILGDGLHVGILLQGKKVRDDSKTLLQTGISQDDKLRSLGFMLEPTHAQINPPPLTESRRFRSESVPNELSGHMSPLVLHHGNSTVSPVSPKMKLGNSAANDFGTVHSLANISSDNSVSDSKAMVAVPGISVEALALVPFRRKSGHSECVPRRIRRPFSVSEVEALVQAVEKLGTGRWRDVKLRAFDNANHRTYVDLKDKWKTLVHTARISPQQRRGEPVPQELLDRVLAAHAYWSQQQVKQHVKAPI